MRDVIGHEQTQMLLTRAAASAQVAHAYLLAGPDGIGKTTLARAFAQLLQCEQADLTHGEPCGVCGSCRKVLHGNHPDVTLVEPEAGKRLLGVDAVREAVVRLANLAPSTGRWRIFILPAVDRMTPNTVNALLKTLEEPPAGVVLLLTSAEPENLLPTLISRCQVITLQPLAHERIMQALRDRWSLPPEEAAELADLANGRLGWAVRAHEDPELRRERAQHLREVMRLTRSSRDERLRAAGTLAADGDTARSVLEVWMLWWRDVTLAACGASHLMSSGSAAEEARLQGQALGRDRAQAFLNALLGARNALDQNANPRLTFDVLMLDLPHLSGAAIAQPRH